MKRSKPHPPPAPPRSEIEVFTELSDLCVSPGYIHAIAAFCLRDGVIYYDEGKLTGTTITGQLDRTALCRTEIATLIGLWLRRPFDLAPPPMEALERYFTRTAALMEELHKSLMCQTARKRDPLWAPKRDPFFTVFERRGA